MAEQSESAQRTEEATPKRLREARDKGDAPRSQEIAATAMLAAGALGIAIAAGPAARVLARAGEAFIARPHAFAADGGALVMLWRELALALLAAFGPLALGLVGVALLANIGQARPVLDLERLKPELKKISPLAGAKRIFGPSGLFNFAKGVAKILIVGALLVAALWPDRATLIAALGHDPRALLGAIRALSLKLLMLTVFAMAIIAALDYAFQASSWKKRLRMTKEEVKRELKETEGDPQIKARLTATRETRGRRRALEATRSAAVLIMNPTHFAVALDYEMGADGAPRCAAKGVDALALRMREAAREAGVPIVENAPLARALHAGVAEGEEIPVEHYKAVAEIIGFVMRKAEEASKRPI